MKFDNNYPVYLQIIIYLKQKIVTGDLGRGDKLPSVRELSKEVLVNPNTVQRAYRELEDEGLIYSKRGLGSFVTENSDDIERARGDMAENIIKEFIGKMERIGYSYKDIIEEIREYANDEQEEDDYE